MELQTSFNLIWKLNNKACLVKFGREGRLPTFQELCQLATRFSNRHPNFYTKGDYRYVIKTDQDILDLWESGILAGGIYVKFCKVKKPLYAFRLVWESGSRDKACMGYYNTFPTVKELKTLAKDHFRLETDSWPILFVQTEDHRYFIKTDADLFALYNLGILTNAWGDDDGTISVKFRKFKTTPKETVAPIQTPKRKFRNWISTHL